MTKVHRPGLLVFFLYARQTTRVMDVVSVRRDCPKRRKVSLRTAPTLAAVMDEPGGPQGNSAVHTYSSKVDHTVQE